MSPREVNPLVQVYTTSEWQNSPRQSISKPMFSITGLYFFFYIPENEGRIEVQIMEDPSPLA